METTEEKRTSSRLAGGSSRGRGTQLSEPRHAEPLVSRRNQRRTCRKFVLCFDGTGNKFSGSDADSNILKIYRCLDRGAENQFHYYQPGIGTYVSAKSISSTGRVARLKSWYQKAKDSAVGTSFADHVMAGYKFLMRYYTPGDEIYFFGFSRGAYTARFLAEMLDHVGLLSAGNEEMARFAWKTFQKWQTRQESTPEEKASKQEMLKFMLAFRETFSRPVHRIRFLGLFDTVNSVPKFETAWMQRSKFPYTARSTAKVIRHAVSIDERRAKFRQDLMSEVKPHKSEKYRRHHYWHHRHADDEMTQKQTGKQPPRGRKTSNEILGLPTTYRDRSETSGVRSVDNISMSSVSQTSIQALQQSHHYDDLSDEESKQDISEVWFAGCHADIGGGWPLQSDEDASLSHVPLVWMIREAQRAGLRFDQTKLRFLNCYPGEIDHQNNQHQPNDTVATNIPTIQVDRASPGPETGIDPFRQRGQPETPENEEFRSHFHRHLHSAATAGRIHDVLQRRNGATSTSVLCWNIMEYLPFRRMDLQPDGSWKSINWPLPKGEVRDIPDSVVVHNTVIKRMERDPNYRPGNLICGGGGRGVRRAPDELGIGKWKVLREEGDAVGECYGRDDNYFVEKNGGANAGGAKNNGTTL